MIIFPAIDIKEGKVVRLAQGRFSEVTEYSTDPVTIAQEWVDKGATWLHIVDLDGAQSGRVKNFDIIAGIVQSVNVPVQTGGGIREKEDIARLLKSGVQRVILGTKVIEDRKFLKKVLAEWKDRIAVSIDSSNGYVAQRGWTNVTDLKAAEFAKELENLGLQYLIYTDIKHDGMLTGPDIEGINEILDSVKTPVIIAGGISNITDIQNLLPLESKGLMGVITGKAIYEGTLNLTKAVKLCSQNE